MTTTADAASIGALIGQIDEERAVALDLQQLKEYDNARLRELDQRVTSEVNGEVQGRKRAIEESRAKKRKKAQKARRQQQLSRR